MSESILDKLENSSEMNNDLLTEIKKELVTNDILLKCDIIEQLDRFLYSEDILQIVIHLFYDKNYLVRCNAYDTIRNVNNGSILKILLKNLKAEKNSMVRMYILTATIYSIENASEENIKQLLNLYKKERSLRTKIFYWSVLYIITTDIIYVYKILSCFKFDDYHIRCNVINAIDDIYSQNIKHIVLSAYQKQYNKEKAIAVKAGLEKMLKKYNT